MDWVLLVLRIKLSVNDSDKCSVRRSNTWENVEKYLDGTVNGACLIRECISHGCDDLP